MFCVYTVAGRPINHFGLLLICLIPDQWQYNYC